jgi:hypothetical protein
MLWTSLLNDIHAWSLFAVAIVAGACVAWLIRRQ